MSDPRPTVTVVPQGRLPISSTPSSMSQRPSPQLQPGPASSHPIFGMRPAMVVPLSGGPPSPTHPLGKSGLAPVAPLRLFPTAAAVAPVVPSAVAASFPPRTRSSGPASGPDTDFSTSSEMPGGGADAGLPGSGRDAVIDGALAAFEDVVYFPEDAPPAAGVHAVVAVRHCVRCAATV